MKLIIDIDEEVYKRFAKAPRTATLDECMSERKVLVAAITNGTPIPDNATNGDAVDAVFPNVDFVTDVFGGFNFPKWWWNAPYQNGGK